MPASSYVNTYLNLDCWVGDTFTTTWVRNYLQSGLDDKAKNAAMAYADFVRGVGKLLGKPGLGALPNLFEIKGDEYLATSMWRVYNGKGAPDEIQDALWLASLCGLVDDTSVDKYCDNYLGIDCGGFVANYWGMGHPSKGAFNPTGATGFKPRTIWGLYPSLRRRSAPEIRVDDAAIFFKDVKNDNPDIMAGKNPDGSYNTSSGSQAFHIGLVSSVTLAGANSVTLEIAESSGATTPNGGTGVNVRSLGTVAATVANKLVYCPDGKNRIYFIGSQSAAFPYPPYSYGAS
ncbi:MAG: hypothetical protein U0Q16_28300 [Bryobacteraceae bacterium]